MGDYYEIFKVIHIIAVISWMAGMLYLPRIFVYHAQAKVGGDVDKTFQVMEYKLLYFIMTPAMIITYIFGLLNAYIYGVEALGVWFHIKFGCVLLLSMMQGLFSRWRKDFAKGKNKKTSRFYRIINEVPTVLMVIIVIMVVMKPFD